MTRVYLHIGYAKCASTTLQRWLLGNAAALGEYGILVPKTGVHDEQHGEFVSSIRQAPDDPAIFERLAAEIEQHSGGSVVLSSEQFCFMSADEIDQLATGLEMCGLSAGGVLCLLRHPLAFVESLYKFNVGNLGAQGLFSDFALQPHVLRQCHYAEVLDRWQARLGVTPQVYALEDLKSESRPVSSVMAEFLGLTSEWPGAESANVSITPLQVYVMRELNARTWHQAQFDRVHQRQIRFRVAAHDALQARDVGMYTDKLQNAITAQLAASGSPWREDWATPPESAQTRVWPPPLNAAETTALDDLLWEFA